MVAMITDDKKPKRIKSRGLNKSERQVLFALKAERPEFLPDLYDDKEKQVRFHKRIQKAFESLIEKGLIKAVDKNLDWSFAYELSNSKP